MQVLRTLKNMHHPAKSARNIPESAVGKACGKYSLEFFETAISMSHQAACGLPPAPVPTHHLTYNPAQQILILLDAKPRCAYFHKRDSVDGSIDEGNVPGWFPLEVHSLGNLAYETEGGMFQVRPRGRRSMLPLRDGEESIDRKEGSAFYRDSTAIKAYGATANQSRIPCA